MTSWRGDTESMLLDVRAGYNVRVPCRFQGRVVYTPGSGVDENGMQGTDKDYDVIGVWGIPHATQWFHSVWQFLRQPDL